MAYHYRESGLDNILPQKCFARHKTKYGAGVSIETLRNCTASSRAGSLISPSQGPRWALTPRAAKSSFLSRTPPTLIRLLCDLHHIRPRISGANSPVTPEKMTMNSHYIRAQLERIQRAKVGAVERLSSGGAPGLEEQMQTMELAISRIRDEMRRREGARLIACLDGHLALC